MTGISIIICTHNPDKFIFRRVLEAIAVCEQPSGCGLECLIIDNKSVPSLEQETYILEILKMIEGGRIIEETNQGLTQARKRGIKEASFSHLLFVDDDNELDKDYLVQICKLIKNHPGLAAFNAGVIRVNFIGIVEEWFIKKAKSYYQDSDLPETIYGNDNKSFSFWPFGTGLLVSKEVCDYYVNKLEQGQFTLTDRNGKTLSSGGDGQMVACAIEMGYSIGRARELGLNHLIAARKANMGYLTRVSYGIYFSGELFMKENFPENLKAITAWQETEILLKTFFLDGFKAILKNDYKKFSVQRSVILGKLAGNSYALNRKPSWIVNRLSREYTV